MHEHELLPLCLDPGCHSDGSSANATTVETVATSRPLSSTRPEMPAGAFENTISTFRDDSCRPPTVTGRSAAFTPPIMTDFSHQPAGAIAVANRTGPSTPETSKVASIDKRIRPAERPESASAVMTSSLNAVLATGGPGPSWTRRPLIVEPAAVRRVTGPTSASPTTSPSLANTPSAINASVWTLRFSAAPKRCTIATPPPRPSATPCSTRARRRSQPSTPRMNTPTTARVHP
jgi:hypothetical protein